MDQVKIGGFLKELRKEKALTQEQLAEKFGVSNRTVSRWENGNNMPDISILIELAEFYDIDMRELLNGEQRIRNGFRYTISATMTITNTGRKRGSKGRRNQK